MGYEALTLSTIRKNIFNTLVTFINANKTGGTAVPSWTVLSAFPEQNPVFPCIIVNPAIVRYNIMGMTRAIKIVSGEVLIEFYCQAKYDKKTIDQEKDKIATAFLNGYSTLRTYNLVLDTSSGSPIEDGINDELTFNNSKMNYASMILRIKDP